MTETQFKRQHEIARNIIKDRWFGESFDKIARKLNIPLTEIRQLRTTEPYQQQVWAEYGRSPHIFNQHKRRECCVRHISFFFGISTEKASAVLGTDWKPPEPTQLQMNF
ncbi:hypothetical protein F4Z99_04115 [Candidatus Poribacteria bacterium]|nr:hypothetical protein [Candidatus Poribacteria bacterium]